MMPPSGCWTVFRLFSTDSMPGAIAPLSIGNKAAIAMKIVAAPPPIRNSFFPRRSDVPDSCCARLCRASAPLEMGMTLAIS